MQKQLLVTIPLFVVVFAGPGCGGFRLRGDAEAYTAAIDRNPVLAEAYYNRGNAKLNKRDLDGAIEDFTEAIRLKPGDAEAYCNRGIAKANKSNFDGAIEDFTEAIRLKPNFAEAYNMRRALQLRKR